MVGVERHKTAIVRNQLSTPMQMLARHGFLDGEHTILDYGCGRGDDVAILREAELPVRGWDPHYAPDTDLSELVDVVNLGFVINVIEEPGERVECLQNAFALCRQCLCVAVMIAGRGQIGGQRPYRDGYVTARGTFQKYYSQSELNQFVEQVLGVEPVPIAPGVILAFRDEVAEQRFFRNRHRREPRLAELLELVSPQAATRARSRQTVTEQYWDTLQELWKKAVELGRLPAEDELDVDVAKTVTSELGSVRRASSLARKAFGLKAFNKSRAARIEDLTLYFALEVFNRRRRYRELPVELQRDIKDFFGAYKTAAEAGKALLFSLGEPATIWRACQQAAEQRLGHLYAEHSLQLHTSLIERLPAPLRVYIGCAEQLYGDIDAADLVKIHIHSGKLTLLYVDDFHGKPLPAVTERVKVKMRQLDVDFFDYSGDEQPPLLYLKSRYMAPDQDGYERQRAFDDVLQTLGRFDFERYGPPPALFQQTLAELGLTISGFTLVPEENAESAYKTNS